MRVEAQPMSHPSEDFRSAWESLSTHRQELLSIPGVVDAVVIREAPLGGPFIGSRRERSSIVVYVDTKSARHDALREARSLLGRLAPVRAEVWRGRRSA
jgi:hypothetical protein